MDLVAPPAPPKRLLAFCRWYSSRLKYGFIRIISEDDSSSSVYKGKDAFVHVSNIHLAHSPEAFPCLRVGEYVECEVEEAPQGLHAKLVVGPWGHALMTEHVHSQYQRRRSSSGGVLQTPPTPVAEQASAAPVSEETV